MKLKTPSFWQQRFHPLALLLWPLGEIYKTITHARLKSAKQAPRLPVPVLCIGNISAGGSGKTPVVQYIAQYLIEIGRNPHILLRGYGGHAKSATRVDLQLHDAHDVGDEALLHAAVAPTWVGSDRRDSGSAAVAAGADIILMDDGMQNISIQPTASWLVMDARRGIGNGYGIPAGPLREDLQHALPRVDAIVLVGAGEFSVETKKPILRVNISMDEAYRAALRDKSIYAFAGIGHPEKIVASLKAAGLDVVGVRGFPDHHIYNEKEIQALRQRAKLLGAQLVTTKKDFVRLPEDLREGIVPVDVQLTWQEPELFRKLLQDVLHEAY